MLVVQTIVLQTDDKAKAVPLLKSCSVCSAVIPVGDSDSSGCCCCF